MFNNTLYNACVRGNLGLVKFLVRYFQVDSGIILIMACQKGNMDLLQVAIEEGATNFNIGLLEACTHGHIAIVKLMIEKGANDWNGGLLDSTSSGNDVISKLMIEKGATDLISGLLNACTAGSLELVESIFETSVNYSLRDINDCLKRASSHGHFEMVKLLIRKGARDYNNALMWTCYNVNDDYVKIRVEKKKEQIEMAKKGLEIRNVIYEEEEEYIKVIKLMIECGADVKTCEPLTRQIIVKTLNIGCNPNYFLHDERLSQIINSHNNLKQHLRTILSHDNDFDSSQLPTDMIDYCIMPYINYNL